VSIEDLIESIGLSAGELKRYVLGEIDEFLAAERLSDKQEEFADLLFALMAMGWAHANRHLPLDPASFEPKVRMRLRQHGALGRHARKYGHDRIPELQIGVVHFAFGLFTGQWTAFDELKNGTVAEIHLLTEAPFGVQDNFTNHCIVTFDDNDSLEYSIIGGSSDMHGGNTVLCRIPDFMYLRARRQLKFRELSEYLSLQVLAALDGLALVPDAIAHFHSWEGGFLLDSNEFRDARAPVRTIFSPYLTVGRLGALMAEVGGDGWTLTRDELAVATGYEQALSAWCARVVVESTCDREFYRRSVPDERLLVRSFAAERSAAFASSPPDRTSLRFIAGGRPVREKGFVELCREFARVHAWAAGRGLEASLSILCRERRPDKGAAYLQELEQTIAGLGLEGAVAVEPKVSLEQLRRRIERSSAVIAPSLYDPYSLLPTYAVEARRPAFVSCHAGVSENIVSKEFTFDPTVEGDLARAIARWYDERPMFRFESRFPSYRDLYAVREATAWT
jgi:hypothetical protein